MRLFARSAEKSVEKPAMTLADPHDIEQFSLAGIPRTPLASHVELKPIGGDP